MEVAEANVTKEFLEEQLKLAVESFSISSGSNAGDNYTSVIYAIEVILKNGEILHLVLKVFPNHPVRQDFLKAVNIFSKEVNVYDQWIPALKNLDPEFKLAFAPYICGRAINFKATDADSKAELGFLDNYLLMTDIRRTSGFTMVDRRKGMNFEHAKIVLTELAKLHACSWVFKKKNGLKFLIEIFPFMKDDTFNEEMMENFKPIMDSFTSKALSHIKNGLGADSPPFKGVEKLVGLDVSDKLKNFLLPEGVDEVWVESLLRVKPEHIENYSTEPWMIGCHGDCWVNNMLFRYKNDTDREKPEEVIFVDLQMVREACPTMDLTYFFVASTSYQMRQKHESELLELYYDQFIRTCVKFNVQPMPGFNLVTLRRKYRRAKIFGFFMGIPILQIVLLDPTEAVDLDGLGEGTKDMTDIFGAVVNNTKKDELLQEQLSGLAQELYNDGVI